MTDKVQIANSHYAITREGKIYNLNNGKELNTYLISGRRYVTISVNTRLKTFTVAKLLATYFLDNYDPKIHKIIFKDGDVLNTTVDNLQIQFKSKQNAYVNKYVKLIMFDLDTPIYTIGKRRKKHVLKLNTLYYMPSEDMMIKYIGHNAKQYYFVECMPNQLASHRRLDDTDIVYEMSYIDETKVKKIF